MTWVKICGMTNLEDALVAVEAGADAVGFVFYEKSPRCVSVETARAICEKLPESVEKIGVFVDPQTDAIRVLFDAGLTGTQEYVSKLGIGGQGGTKAVGIACLPPKARFMLAAPMSFVADHMSQAKQMLEDYGKSRQEKREGFSFPEGFYDTFLLDSGNEKTPGGTGNHFDWKSAEPIAEGLRRNAMRLVVAGGLTPENVGSAIEILHPWGVDVVSGVESRPGKKDPEKVRAFVRAVREWDRKAG